MAAGEEAATAFVETSLGTRLTVSFPAASTTAGHLKSIVSDEHAASFPSTGQIAVESLKVRRKGSWYHLANSVPVRAAFHGVKGAWHLHTHVLPCSECGIGNVLCSQQNAIGDAAASAQRSHAPSTTDWQEQDGHAHLGNAGVILDPIGRKRFREKQDGVCDQALLVATSLTTLVCSVRQDGQNECRHNSMPKRICAAREDGLLDGVDANTQGSGGEVAAHSSNGLEDEGALDGSCCHNEGMEKEEEENRPSALAEPPVELCDHEPKSITNDEQTKLCFSVNENDFAATAMLEHADEGMTQEELADLAEPPEEFRDHEAKFMANNEEPKLCFSVSENDFAAAPTQKHADEGMPQEELAEQQDHLVTSGTEVVLQNCNFKDTSAIHSEHVSDCHQPEVSSRSFDLKCYKSSECEMLTDQVADHDLVCSDLESAPQEKENGRRSDPKGSECEMLTDQVADHDRVCSDLESAPQEKENGRRSDPLPHDLDDCACSLGGKLICGQKEPSIAEVCYSASSKKGKDIPPCVDTLKDINSSEAELVAPKVKGKEPWMAKVCNGESSSKGTDHPPCAGSMREGNSSEKEEMARKVKENEPWIAKAYNGERRRSNRIDHPPCAGSMREGNSSEKEEMSQKGKEKEPWTAKVCNNGGRSNIKGIYLPPCARSMREGNSSKNEGVAHGDNQSTKTVTLVDVDGTKWEVKLEDSSELGKQESSSFSWSDKEDAKEVQSNSAKPRQNAEKFPEGALKNVGRTRVLTKRSGLRHGSFKIPTSNDPTESKHAGGTSADGHEEGAWERRRPRAVVQKIPNSRVAKMYGYR